MPTEVEAKFRADGPGPLSILASEPTLGHATLGAATTVTEVDRYLDTADDRLAAALWACRLRSRGDDIRVSLKGPAEATSGAWLHRRPELEGPATESLDPGDWPDSLARAFLDELRRDEPLDERFELRQRRTERAVTVEEAALGVLSLDAVEVRRDGRGLGELFVIELELSGEGDAASVRHLHRLAETLQLRPGLSADPRTKLEHALELLGSQ
jgi:inorganic triphosphatase YgiF